MGIGVLSFGAVSKLSLAAAIALGSLMSLYLFFCNALKLIINRCDDSQHYPPNLEQELADDGVKFSTEALQASLPSVLYQSLHRVDEDGGLQTCAVCLSEIANVEEVRRLPHCRHLFHTPCIDTWLQCHHRTCPLCRASLLPSASTSTPT